jgi:hypothetical protein
LYAKALAPHVDAMLEELRPFLNGKRYDAELLAHFIRNLVPLNNLMFTLGVHPPPGDEDSCVLFFFFFLLLFLLQCTARRSNGVLERQVYDNAAHGSAVLHCQQPHALRSDGDAENRRTQVCSWLLGDDRVVA